MAFQQMVAPQLMRRVSLSQSAAVSASRSYHQFSYPHSFMGNNNAFNNMPVEKRE